MTSLHDELGRFLRDYEAAWRGGDYDALRALWDNDEEAPIYIPEESEPLFGWDAIQAYFDSNRKVLANVAVRTWDHQVRSLQWKPIPFSRHLCSDLRRLNRMMT